MRIEKEISEESERQKGGVRKRKEKEVKEKLRIRRRK